MEKVTTNNRRGRRSREEILETASRLMAERGYSATTISVLSQETGLPKSAIYHHFSSKAGLLSAVMAKGAYEFFDAMRAAHAAPPEGGTHQERLGWYLQRTGQVFLAQPDFLRLHLLLLMSSETADLVTEVRNEGRAYMNHMIKSSYADEGEEIATAVADALEYFGIAGFDGAFVAIQADPTRSMDDQMALLSEAMAALGDARAAKLRGQAAAARSTS